MNEQISAALGTIERIGRKLDAQAQAADAGGGAEPLTAGDLEELCTALGSLREAEKAATRLSKALGNCHLKSLEKLAASKRLQKLAGFQPATYEQKVLQKLGGDPAQAGEAHARADGKRTALAGRAEDALRQLAEGLARCRERLAAKG